MASAITVHVDQERLNNMSRRQARLEAWNAIAAVKAATEERDEELERRSKQSKRNPEDEWLENEKKEQEGFRRDIDILVSSSDVKKSEAEYKW
jgi:hypothetical protein